jgi:1-deoxy-D-xylulose-5-phosphate synthase
VTFTQAFGDTAIECAEADPAVVAITAAMPDGTGLTKFHKAFPNRYFDTGIAEQHAVTFAAGLAAHGLKPFCAIYSTFLQRGFDQVLHDVCIQNLPVRFFMDRAGLVGDDGPTHHGAFDISFLTLIPNMVLLAPRDTTELAEMTRWMAGYGDHPSAVRYPRGAGDDRLPEARTAISLGKAEILCEAAPDAQETVAICAVGSMVSLAWEARAELQKLGVDAAVINARFVKPIDAETICRAASACGRIVTIEENVQAGGFGQAVRDALHEAGLGHLPHTVIAIPDRFIEQGSVSLIRAECGLSVSHLVESVKALPKNGQGKMAHA